MAEKKLKIPAVLYVDDERENLTSFKFSFMGDYKIHLAGSAKEGMELLAQKDDIKLIITDQRMPEKTGVEFLEDVQSIFPDTKRMVLTGYSDIAAVIQGINKGKIFHYFQKPWDEEEIKLVLNNAWQAYSLEKENKQLLLDLKEANEGLEIKVKERTKELEEANADLIVARDKAEAASRAKSSFLANMSHEMRTPMHGILSNCDLARDDIEEKDFDEVREDVNSIEKSGKRLLGLLNNLLDLAKLEAGKMDMDLAEKDIFNIAEGVFAEIRPLLVKKKIQGKIEKPDFDAKLKLDDEKIFRVFINLLGNAIKFSPEGSNIFVRFIKENDGIKTQIEDHGPGIPVDEVETIFENFSQSSRTDNKAGGTGLGLSLCREMVLKHGGKIWAENNSDKGASFFFFLPYAPEIKSES
ncbi:ATP-binding protein [Candidatus Riflebacteria bacterium]